MAEEIRIAGPRPRLIALSASAVCIGAAGLLLLDSSPEGLDAASIAHLSASLLAFVVGLFIIPVAVSGVPLRQIHAEMLTKLAAAASIAALMLAPPPGRLLPTGTPAPSHDLPEPNLTFTYSLPPIGSPEDAGLAAAGHLESLIVSHVPLGSPVEAVPDPVGVCPVPSFAEDIEDMLSVCPVPSLPNIVLLPLFYEPGIRGYGLKEVI